MPDLERVCKECGARMSKRLIDGVAIWKCLTVHGRRNPANSNRGGRQAGAGRKKKN